MYLKNLILFITLLFVNVIPFSQTVAYSQNEEVERSTKSGYLVGAESSILLMSDHYVNDPDNINSVFGSAYQLLEKAQHSILIVNYVFDNSIITEILNRRAEEGLDVIVVYDRNRSENYIRELHPDIKLFTRAQGDGHMHHKFMVIDHEYNWISSANFNSPQDSNLAIICYDPWLAEILYQESYSINSLKTREHPQPYTTTIDGQFLELYLLPYNDPKNLKSVEAQMNELGKQKLLNLIKQAKKTIRVSMVVWTLKDSARSLVDAAKRGVMVEIVGAHIDNEVLNIFKLAGLPVRRVQNVPFHHKWMLIDDEILWNGSANWSMNAFSRTDDSVTILYDLKPDQITMMEEAWQKLLKISH